MDDDLGRMMMTMAVMVMVHGDGDDVFPGNLSDQDVVCVMLLLHRILPPVGPLPGIGRHQSPREGDGRLVHRRRRRH